MKVWFWVTAALVLVGGLVIANYSGSLFGETGPDAYTEEFCGSLKSYEIYQDFYEFAQTLPAGSKILAWWDLGQCIKTETGVDSVLEHYSEEACPSVGVFVGKGKCPGPFEDHEKLQDVSRILLADVDKEALCLAKTYGSTHLILTSDLVGKSPWWTYFAEGIQHSYTLVENAPDGALTYTQNGIKFAIDIPQELQNSLFTKLFLLDDDLTNFELVNNFGDEIKVYSINYPSGLAC